MLGAIAGDIIGSPYEWNNVKWTDFDLETPLTTFTDDSVLTVATANSILTGVGYDTSFRELGLRHFDRGYGGMFRQWLRTPGMGPYDSWGNGSAMRVSPVGFAFDSIEDVLVEARKNAEVTHNHPEGIKGAQATALAVFLARTGVGKDDIRQETADRFGYDMDRTLDEIRPDYEFDGSCQGTVPESIIAFLEGDDYEDTIRKAVSIGGDSDTVACIAGAVAQAFYGGVPENITSMVWDILSADLLKIMDRFNKKFGL